ncbi:MAG: hypothetical protein H0V45_07105 [Actinobacteria bacterium]|nr:hypothetical protein [Actinomycetota bacterium]
MKRVIALAIAVAALVALPAQGSPPVAKQIAQLKRQVAALQTKVATLTDGNRKLVATNAELRQHADGLEAENSALRRYIGSSSACPVTTPNRSNPPGVAAADSTNIHGNGVLWVAIAYGGVIPAGESNQQPDGSIRMKFPWWRGVFGELKITGVRLDAAAPPLRVEIPSGYGNTGFQASGLIFPTEGCWEVTGRVGSAALTLVVQVVRA